MKLPAYPKYKPSGLSACGHAQAGVEWLGDVPEHWTPIALRRTSTRYAGGTPDRSNDSYWDDGTIPWINSGAVNQGLITEPSAFITEEAYRNSSARWVAKGSLVMALAGQGKTKGMVAQTGIATTCNQSMAAICSAPPMEARYLYWLLLSQYEHIRNMAGGEARDGLNLEILGAIPCLKVPPAEQRSIAAFLDRETGRIDRLVAKKRELIERLKEKRTALISRTVTRGLPVRGTQTGLPPAAARAAGIPANPPLKPSGLDWLGDISQHWSVSPIKFLVSTPITDGPHETPEILDEGIPFVSAEAVSSGRVDFERIRGHITAEDHKRFCKKYKPKRGDIYLIKSGATTGRVAMVETDIEFNIWSPLAAIRCNPKQADKNFVYFYMQSNEFRTAIELSWNFGTQQNIGMGVIQNLGVPCPPVPEQAAVAAYLDEETAKLDALAEKIEEAVERLQEYRTALITAAVTGKIDVRSAVPGSGAAQGYDLPRSDALLAAEDGGEYSVTRHGQD